MKRFKVNSKNILMRPGINKNDPRDQNEKKLRKQSAEARKKTMTVGRGKRMSEILGSKFKIF